MTARRKSSTRRPRVSAPSRSQTSSDNPNTAAAAPDDSSTATAAGASPSSAQPKSISPSNPPPTPTRRHPFESLKNTPIKVGSHSKGPTTSSANAASYARTRRSEPAAPAPMTQAQLDINIESEMHNAIFHDPGFIKHFLAGDSTTLDAVLAECRQSEAYTGDGQWALPDHIEAEPVLYTPVLKILNTIKRSVDRVRNNPRRGEQGFNLFSDDDPDHVPLKPDFRDRHSRAVDSDEAETAGLKPDIVLFDTHKVEHWETVRMSIEIKKLPSHHKAAMKQLSRYARATFAHQLHRRHLFGLTICGTEATFVLFDRAGILYSPRIDMKTQFEDFTQAMASLLLLDPADEGYDTMFEAKLNGNRRLKYYVNLPMCAFENSPSTPVAGSSRESNPPGVGRTRKFEVVDRLCHRKSIRGRATIVLRLREVRDFDESDNMETRAKANGKRKREETDEPEELEIQDYVLKIIWRDPARDSEGEVMQRFKGMFGLAQHVWHSDAPGQCRCPSPVEGRCWAPSCVASTAQWDEMEVCDNLRDIKISVPVDDENDKEKDLVQVDTTQHRPALSPRMHRICSYILMSSIGVLLSEANDPSEFMNAVLDAILGYWRLFNMGILHRDISDGNVMILDREETTEATNGNEINDEKGRESRPEEAWLAALRVHEPVLAQSEDALQKYRAKLLRDPTGMLSDFDLHAKHTLFSPLSGITSTLDRAAETTAENSHDRTNPLVQSSSTVMPPESKRRRTNSRQGVPISSRTSTIRPELASRAQDRQKGKIDFRTGTPAFMSIRVSRTKPGTAYHHSYLDDLESFFWLIYWSVAAHRDDDSRPTSEEAQYVLDCMNNHSLKLMADWKRSQLVQCGTIAEEMEDTLESLQNQWASDSIFRQVILGLGEFFFEVDRRMIPRDAPPASVFSRVVDIIMNALGIV